MKGIIIITSLLFISSCKEDNCYPLDVSAFTHYQINVSEDSIIWTDKLPPFPIYDKPNGKVIFNLPPDDESGWVIVIEEIRDGYLKFGNGWRPEIITKNKELWVDWWEIANEYEYFWIKIGSVAVKLNDYDGKKIPLHSKPNSESKLVGVIRGPQVVLIMNVCRDWAYIEGENGEIGWLERKWRCPDPGTTCN